MKQNDTNGNWRYSEEFYSAFKTILKIPTTFKVVWVNAHIEV